MEVNAAAGHSGIGFGLHNNIVAPYIERYGTHGQKAKYLPAMARGEIIGAIAMSEPAAGSDLQGIKATAIRQDDGSDLQCKVMDECLQLFGGYGYMWEYPIARAFADARVSASTGAPTRS